MLLAASLIAYGYATSAAAMSSSSSSYEATEMQFGSGSSLESCSGEYCARVSIGDMSAEEGLLVGRTASFDPTPGDEPMLEVIIEPGVSNLGDLTAEKTAVKTMIVKVRNHLSSGYILQVAGDPPVYEGHALKTPATPSASTPGKEQFAINAVANSSPQVGADPRQASSDQSVVDKIEENYRLPNLFMYKSGDVVARSSGDSGQVDYTISMIVNISSATPAGLYASDYSAIVVPVY